MSKPIPKEVVALGEVIAAVQELDATQQSWVFDSAMSNLGLAAQPPKLAKGTVGLNSATTTLGDSPTAKEFLRAKNPQSDVQRVACLAYFLAHHRQTPHFKTRELTSLNLEAAGTPIGNASQAVNNATKQSHYLAPAGGGKKQITAHGEEVVNALPDQAAVATAEKNRPKKRKASKKAPPGGPK